MEKFKLVLMSGRGQINYLIPKEGLTDIIVSTIDGMVLCNGEIIDPLVSQVINGDEIIRLEPGMKLKQ